MRNLLQNVSRFQTRRVNNGTKMPFSTYKSKGTTKKRPMVHLSSALDEKYNAKHIGAPHPIIPHEVTERLLVPDHIPSPSYAKSGKAPPMKEDIVTINNNNDDDIEAMQRLRNAGQLAADMLQLASSMARQGAGLTTDEIDKFIHHKIIEAGAYPSTLNYNRFPKSLCISINEVACHGIPDLRTLEVGDLVSLDIAVYLDGVHGDNCNTVLVEGTADLQDDESFPIPSDYEDRSARACALIETTNKAMLEAINICHAGTPLCEIGNTVQRIAQSNGYRPMKIVTGHGVGVDFHTPPEIKHFRNKDKAKLKAGMVLTVEPCLVEGHGAHITFADGWTISTVDGGLSCQMEHTIYINETGPPEILTIPHERNKTEMRKQ